MCRTAIFSASGFLFLLTVFQAPPLLASAEDDLQWLQVTQSVTVQRGSTEAEAGSGAEAKGDEVSRSLVQGVTVLRGPAIDNTPPAQQSPADEQALRFQTSSGEDLWFYDPVEETVRTCRLFGTTQVSRYRIRCFERRL